MFQISPGWPAASILAAAMLLGPSPPAAQVQSGATQTSVSTYAGAVLADAPLAYWRLDDDGALLADASGHDRAARAIGGVTTGVQGALPADSDTAVQFDGTSGYVQPPPLPVSSDFTVEGWSNLSDDAATVANNAIFAAYGKVFLLARATGFYASVWIAGTEYLLQDFTPLNLREWTYWVLARSGPTLSVYRDGALVARRDDLPAAPPDDLNGTMGASGGAAYFHHGQLDEVAVYPTAIGANRVWAHYIAARPDSAPLPNRQHLIVPAYAGRGDTDYWDRLLTTVPPGCAIVLGDKDGPLDATISDLIARIHARNCRALFYVGSNYGQMNRRNLNGVYVTLDSVHQAIDDGYRYDIDGIFVDEGDTLLAPEFYASLRDYIKNRSGVRETFEIMNAPGYQTRPDVIDLADVVIKSEQSWSSTLNQTWATFTRAWPAAKVGVIVVGVPNDEPSGLLAVRLSRQFGAGWIYLTDLFDPRGTHYSSLPHDPLWSVELGATGP